MASKSMTFDLFARNSGKSGFDSFSQSGVQAVDKLVKKAAELAAAYVGINAILDFGKESVAAATAAEQANSKLETAVKNTGVSYTGLVPQIDAAEAAGRKLGFTNDDIATGLAQLTTSTRDPLKALSEMQVAEDLAAKKNESLSVATTAVSRVLAGTGAKSLSQFGIVMDGVGTKTEQGQRALDELSKELEGTASNAADTASGKMKAYEASVDATQEKIGEALMPVLERLVDYAQKYLIPALDGFSDWFSKNGGPAVSEFMGWIDKIPGGFGQAVTSFGLLTGAAYALDVALDANPVGAVLAGLAAIGLLATAVALNWNTIGNTISVVQQQITKGIEDAILTAQIVVENALAAIGDALLNTFLAPVNAIRALAGQKPITIKLNFSSGTQAFEDQYNSVLNASINGAAKAGSAGGAGGTPAKALASGGTIYPRPGGTLARIGEGGRAETVVDTATLQAAMRSRGGGINLTVWQQPGETIASTMKAAGFLAGQIA